MGTTLNVEVWDTTAANNDDADAGIVWTEGQSPSTVNNSARGMMAAVAKWKLDISGGIVAGGTGNAITLTTNRSISSGHITNGFMVFFRASAANSGATTVAIDALTAKDIKAQDGSALAGGEIISGGIYILSWSSTANAFILINAASSVTASSTVTFTNKTIDADSNTISNIEVDNFKTSAIVTEAEGLASSDNDTSLPTTAAVKDYVDDLSYADTSVIVTITDAADPALNAQSGRTKIARLTATGDRQLAAPTNPLDGQKIIIEHTASGGARTMSLATGSSGQFRYGTDITALTATTSGKTDRVGVIYNASAQRWDVVAYAKGF